MRVLLLSLFIGALLSWGVDSVRPAGMCNDMGSGSQAKTSIPSIVLSGMQDGGTHDGTQTKEAASRPLVPAPGEMDWSCGWCEDGQHHHPSVWATAMEQNGSLSPGSLHISCPSGYYPPSQVDGRPSRATASIARHEIGKYIAAIGNPNLRVGKATDKGDYFEVEVLTKGSSVVDKLYWDKDFVGFYCDCPFHQDLRLKLRGKLENTPPLLTEKQAKDAASRTAGIGVNPNLKIGGCKLKGMTYEVEVLTKDGSLVDHYLVDGRSGQVRSAYPMPASAPAQQAAATEVSSTHQH